MPDFVTFAFMLGSSEFWPKPLINFEYISVVSSLLPFSAIKSTFGSMLLKSELIDSFLEADNFFLYCKKDINWLNPTENINFSTDLNKIIDEIKQSTEIVDIVILMSNGDTNDIIEEFKKN